MMLQSIVAWMIAMVFVVAVAIGNMVSLKDTWWLKMQRLKPEFERPVNLYKPFQCDSLGFEAWW